MWKSFGGAWQRSSGNPSAHLAHDDHRVPNMLSAVMFSNSGKWHCTRYIFQLCTSIGIKLMVQLCLQNFSHLLTCMFAFAGVYGILYLFGASTSP